MNEARLEDSSSFDEQHIVVQKNISYFDLKWRAVKDPAKQNTWNWIAFFFSPFWLAYRKMYKPFFVLALIELLYAVPFYLVDLPAWLDGPFYLIIAIVVGLNGNRWYYKHTLNILKQSKSLSDSHQASYLQTKGGTHIGILVGLNVLVIALFFLLDMGLSYLPSETNIKDVVRLSVDAETLEIFTDDPKWSYVKKDGRSYIVEFTGYDYSEKEDVRIVFNVYLDKYIYEWKEIYINGKKLNKKDAEDYELWIEDNSY
ncbi:DUF2628 domain-containing protein [Fictibacillus barbaricus]|uniref:DUF2628 domain-containing protein n=1 Tax=Fictibacillus barbaricus TaxID=182136 RepID=A0ABU1U1E7_9BACL|nr:DUF2628 domain-containing protein [Fictibacillus barbaricus]MDR7073263.1 hypothetical protein [Fictibacillus barbaricus]